MAKKKTWLSENFKYTLNCIVDDMVESSMLNTVAYSQKVLINEEELKDILERHLYNLELDIVDIMTEDNREPY